MGSVGSEVGVIPGTAQFLLAGLLRPPERFHLLVAHLLVAHLLVAHLLVAHQMVVLQVKLVVHRLWELVEELVRVEE